MKKVDRLEQSILIKASIVINYALDDVPKGHQKNQNPFGVINELVSGVAQSSAKISPNPGVFKRIAVVLNLHRLLVFRHNDLGFGLQRAQRLGVGEALRFLAVDAIDCFDVAGKSFDVALQFVFVRMAGIGVQ